MTPVGSPPAWIERPEVRSVIREILRPLNPDATADSRKFLIVHGDRGSGRSSLLEAVCEEVTGVVPVGAVDLSSERLQNVSDCLAVLAEELGARVPGRRRVLFPRLLLGLAVSQARDAEKDSGAHTRASIRELLKSVRVKSWGRVVFEQSVGEATVTVPLGPLGSIAGVNLPVSAAGQAMDLRRLRPYVRWYSETFSSSPQDGLDVLAQLAREGRVSRGHDLEAVLCAAFVADLHHALGRARGSAVPVILVDNAEQPVGELMLERLLQAHVHVSGDAPFPAGVVASTLEPRGGSPLLTERELPPLDTDQCLRLMSWQDESPRAVKREEARLIRDFSGGNTEITVTLVRERAELPEYSEEDQHTLHAVLAREGYALEERLLDTMLDWSGLGGGDQEALEICALSRTREHAVHLAAQEGTDVRGAIDRILPFFYSNRQPSWMTPFRHLLVRRLARSRGGDDRWTRYHESLASHCELTRDRTGALHHTLAIGGTGAVTDRLLEEIDGGGPVTEWLDRLIQVTRAPHGDTRYWGEAPRARYARLCEASDRAGTGAKRATVRRLVAAYWTLADPLGEPDRSDIALYAADALTNLSHHVVGADVLSDEAQAHRERSRALRERAVVIPLPPASRRLVVPPSRKVRNVVALGVAVVALAGGVGGGIAATPYLRCDGPGSGLRMIDGECVGVNDSSYPFDPAFSEVQNLIKAENDWVTGQVEGSEKKSAVRIALMTTLEPDDESALSVGQVHSALWGAYTAQYRANRTKAFRGDHPLIKLYLANEGEAQQHWGEAVAGVKRMSQGDEPLLMVVGPGLSSASALEAAQSLEEADIPMVSAIITADDMEVGEGGEGLLHISPTNSDFVAALLAYTEAPENRFTSGNLLYDRSEVDNHVLTLREAFQSSFRHVIGDSGNWTFTGQGMGQDVGPNLSMPTSQICSQNKDLLLFAGREGDLKDFVAEVADTQCRTGEPLTVFYAASGPIRDGAFHKNLEKGNLDLVMAASTHPGWLDASEGGRPVDFGGFQEVLEELSGQGEGLLYDGYAIMHHDAVATAVTAVRLAQEGTGGRSPTSKEVRAQVFNLHSPVRGAGGRLSFTDAGEGRPHGKWVPIIRMGKSYDGIETEAVWSGAPQG